MKDRVIVLIFGQPELLLRDRVLRGISTIPLIAGTAIFLLWILVRSINIAAAGLYLAMFATPINFCAVCYLLLELLEYYHEKERALGLCRTLGLLISNYILFVIYVALSGWIDPDLVRTR